MFHPLQREGQGGDGVERMVITVEMGEGVVSETPNIITTVGCGSCVVVVLYDAKRRVGGLAHVMLPDYNGKRRAGETEKGRERGFPAGSPIHQFTASPYQFASTAVPTLLEEMRKRGCSRRNIMTKIAGGAKMFSSYAEFPAGIGEQNVKSVRQLLEREGIPLMGFDVGGCYGRSVEFYLDSGRVFVKAFGREDREI